MILQLTDNSKVKFKSKHYNTFGLNYGRPENGGTCPHATLGEGGCLGLKRKDGKTQTCYMAKLVKAWPSVALALQRNTDILAGKDRPEMVIILTDMVTKFVEKHAGNQPYFRLHYSGDFFNREYAEAWLEVVKAFPKVKFWVYSREFDYANLFAGLDNIVYFLSVDPVNYEEGKKAYDRLSGYHNIGMAWMGDSPPKGEVRWVTCPETSGKVKNSSEQGACSKCRLCVHEYRTKVRNISFNIH